MGGSAAFWGGLIDTSPVVYKAKSRPFSPSVGCGRILPKTVLATRFYAGFRAPCDRRIKKMRCRRKANTGAAFQLVDLAAC